MVPIRHDLLDAARRQRLLTVLGLARKAGIRQQTVHAMLRPPDPGKMRRCRLSNREKLAQALGLHGEKGSEWLGGEEQVLPGATYYVEDGIFPYDKFDGLIPDFASLSEHRYWTRCREAIERDAADNNRDSKTSALFPPIRVLEKLTKAYWWRMRLLGKKISLESPPAEMVEISSKLVEAFELLLEPWLAGDADLDYQFLAYLSPILFFGVPVSEPPAPTSTDQRP